MKASFNPPAKINVILLVAGILCANLISIVAQTTLTNGLIGYWPLDTTDGTNTPDLALNNSLLLVNAPNFVTSSNVTRNTSNCLSLTSASSQYLILSHSTNNAGTGLPIYTTHGYSVAFWVRGPAGLAANQIIFCENTFNNSALLFEFNTGGPSGATANRIRVNVKGDDNTTHLNNKGSTTIVFDGNWHHIGWTDTNGTCKLYIDGNLDASSFNYTVVNPVPALPPTGNTLSVGALSRTTGTTLFFNGSVDEVMAWNRVLSQAEIQGAISNGIPSPILATPPTLVTQPASATNAMGDRVILNGNFFGNQPMTFQWLSNGVAMTGQTNLALLLTSLTNASTNAYSLQASNAFGTNTTPANTLVVATDPTNNVVSGMVSYWPFDAVTNSATPDLVSQNDMQLVNTPGLVSGQFSNGLSFDGSTQYANEVTGTPIYDLSTTYTVALWVKGASGVANEQTFANGNSTNGNYFFIGPDNTGASGKVDVRINSGVIAVMSDTLSTQTAFDNTWHHVVWVDQNGTGLLYIDGVLDPTIYSYAHGALGALTLNNTTVGALAANPLRDWYNGNVDDVGTWNRRLTYSEIQAIRASGIPAPPVIAKPSLSPVTTQPTTLAGNVYQGDTVSFTVGASGTAPFSYHWQTNGVPLSTIGNPSVLSNTLVLTNVQPVNSGNYSVIVTNAGGAATSSVVQLTVTPYTPATNGTVLLVDFNYNAAPVPQPGFSSMTLLTNPATFGGPEITLTPIGATFLSDRVRTVPTNNPPAMTQADIYSQIIFSTANTSGTGIDILVQRLAPNTKYGLTMWSYDSQNDGISDWTEVASGSPVSLNGYPGNLPFYAFVRSQPANDYVDTFGALLTSSPTGQLELQGVVDPGNAVITVFLNAMRLVANPQIQITSAQVVAGNLQLTIATQYPWQTIDFQESATLSPGSWATATDATVISTYGPVVTVQFPISSTKLFYRVVSP